MDELGVIDGLLNLLTDSDFNIDLVDIKLIPYGDK